MTRFMALGAALLCLACSTAPALPELVTVPHVDLRQYLGKWYEIARLPAWFQKGCLQSTATYGLDASGHITVLNECLMKDGTRKSASGRAFVVDRQSQAKLEVVFDNWFSRIFPGLVKGKYWILYVDPGYRNAVVGTPDRKYLWFLSRNRTVEDATYAEFVRFAESRGFRTDRLIRAENAGL